MNKIIYKLYLDILKNKYGYVYRSKRIGNQVKIEWYKWTDNHAGGYYKFWGGASLTPPGEKPKFYEPMILRPRKKGM